QGNANGPDRMEKSAIILRKVSDEGLAGLRVVLRPEQMSRLKQIELQERGLRALNDPDVEKALNLTATPKNRIQDLTHETEGAMRQVLGGGGQKRLASSAALQELLKARRQMMAKAVELLTTEQKTAWIALAGVPFELKIQRRTNR